MHQINAKIGLHSIESQIFAGRWEVGTEHNDQLPLPFFAYNEGLLSNSIELTIDNTDMIIFSPIDHELFLFEKQSPVEGVDPCSPSGCFPMLIVYSYIIWQCRAECSIKRGFHVDPLTLH